MHTITVFAPKGGSGRTTAVMALAAGFLALGKQVLVQDVTEYPVRKNAMLRRWFDGMAADGAGAGRLDYAACFSGEQVSDAHAAARARGVEILLIDTGRYLDPQQRTALHLADLVLCPAIGTMEAGAVAEGVGLEHPAAGPFLVAGG